MSVDRGAKLLGRTGPFEGACFPFLDGEMTFGRDVSNTICLESDRAVSRHHFSIITQDGDFLLRDLDSANRTYVNDVPVTGRVLEHGDEIRVGRSTFVFLLDGLPAPEKKSRVDLDTGEPVHGSTVVLHRPEALYIQADRMVDQVGRSGRAARDLKTILEISKVLQGTARLDELEQRLLESACQAIPGQRAAIVLTGRSSNEFESALYWLGKGRPAQPFRLPRAVVQQVLSEHAAVCVNGLSNPENPASSETVVHASVTSMIAAPLIASDAAIGAIYLDTSDVRVVFTEEDMQLLAGIAEISSAPLAAAVKLEQLENETRRLAAELVGGEALIGASDAMRTVHRFIAKVAPSDSTVLITGSSGTGKELVARALHRNSARSGKPFIAINCAAVADTLLESEFFGHEKGAFTGAFTQKKGKLEEADGGTVFLDEVGELALPLQAKLLRVLQEREFQRVGSSRSIRVNIRVVAATNRDLEHEIRRGTFRQDLYYRLNVVAVAMPDLRERRKDIPLLANHFLRKQGAMCGRRITGISPQAMSCLVAHDWPGNVRELENAIERAIVLGATDQILPEDLPDAIVESAGASEDSGGLRFHETIREFKKQLVTNALQQANGSHTEAAKTLGLHPNNLHRLLRTLNLRG